MKISIKNRFFPFSFFYMLGEFQCTIWGVSSAVKSHSLSPLQFLFAQKFSLQMNIKIPWTETY